LKVAYSTRYLLISCHNPEELQFKGIREAADRLLLTKGFSHFTWTGEQQDLRRRRVLTWVLISGHGSADFARLGDNQALFINRQDIRLPPGTALYLLGCYQGRSRLKKEWAEGCTIPESRVHGCPAETESGLSTCLLLQLLRHGPQTIGYWYGEWLKANRQLRPHFPLLRRLYSLSAGDPLLTFSKLKGLIDLDPVMGFIKIALEYPQILSDLHLS
jgi:hypothetical protein